MTLHKHDCKLEKEKKMMGTCLTVIMPHCVTDLSCMCQLRFSGLTPELCSSKELGKKTTGVL